MRGKTGKNVGGRVRIAAFFLTAVQILLLLTTHLVPETYAEETGIEQFLTEQDTRQEPSTDDTPAEDETPDNQPKNVEQLGEKLPESDNTRNSQSTPEETVETNQSGNDPSKPFLDEDYIEYRLWDRYSQSYTVKTGEAIRQKFLQSAVSFTGIYNDDLYTSAMYVTTCADMAGMVETGMMPLTPNVDELFCSLENRDFSTQYDLSSYLNGTMMSADDANVLPENANACTGSLIFLLDGSDSAYREWMKAQFEEYTADYQGEENGEPDPVLQYPFYDFIQYREVRIVIGEGPGYFITAGVNGAMVPGIEIITADNAPEDAVLLKIRFEGEAEKLANCIAEYSGFNDAAIAGILSNIYYESSFRADKVGDCGFSFGLCQWQGQRRQNLIEYCELNGMEETDMEAQVAFMIDELKTQYPQTYAYLKSIRNDSEGAYYAASRFCLWYEVPSDCYEKAAYRGGAAEFLFYNITAARAGYHFG